MCVCVWERCVVWERMCVCVRERENVVCVCVVWERERMCGCVCVRERNVCVCVCGDQVMSGAPEISCIWYLSGNAPAHGFYRDFGSRATPELIHRGGKWRNRSQRRHGAAEMSFLHDSRAHNKQTRSNRSHSQPDSPARNQHFHKITLTFFSKHKRRR